MSGRHHLTPPEAPSGAPSARMLDLTGMPYAAAAFRLMEIGVTPENALRLAAAGYDVRWEEVELPKWVAA